MKYEKGVTINLGNFQTYKIAVSEAPSFEECSKKIIEELRQMQKKIDNSIAYANIEQVIEWLQM
jgi:hypothetical protein